MKFKYFHLARDGGVFVLTVKILMTYKISTSHNPAEISFIRSENLKDCCRSVVFPFAPTVKEAANIEIT